MCSVCATSMICTQDCCVFLGFYFNAESTPGCRISREMEENDHTFSHLFESVHLKFLVTHML